MNRLLQLIVGGALWWLAVSGSVAAQSGCQLPNQALLDARATPLSRAKLQELQQQYIQPTFARVCQAQLRSGRAAPVAVSYIVVADDPTTTGDFTLVTLNSKPRILIRASAIPNLSGLDRSLEAAIRASIPSGASGGQSPGGSQGQSTAVVAGGCNFVPGQLLPNNPERCQISDLFGLIDNLTKWLLRLAGGVALIFLIWGAFQYFAVAGDESKIEEAKRRMTYAIGGLILVICAQLFVQVTCTFFSTSQAICGG